MLNLCCYTLGKMKRAFNVAEDVISILAFVLDVVDVYLLMRKVSPEHVVSVVDNSINAVFKLTTINVHNEAYTIISDDLMEG